MIGLNLPILLFRDPRELFDEDGQLRPFVDLPGHVLQGIADVQVRFALSSENDDEGRPFPEFVFKIKFNYKVKAL